MVRGTLFEEVGFALERDNAHKAEGVGDVVDILVTEGALCTGECGVGSGAPRAPGPCRSPRCDVRVGRRCGLGGASRHRAASYGWERQEQQLKEGRIRAHLYWHLHPERGCRHSQSSIHYITRTDSGTSGVCNSLQGHSRALRDAGGVYGARGHQRSQRSQR